MTDTAIEFVDVVKCYGAVTAVDTINFSISRGELVTFLGPSGCGKTTSLRLIAGLELPTSGTVRIAGEDVSTRAAPDRNVGMVFQSYALFPHMSVIENVAYGPTIRGSDKKSAIARGHEILSMLGLEGLGKRLPSELSGGQQQRVAVARAIVQQPDVLLFDEPLSNVDAKLRRRVREEIRDLQRRFNLTAVYVTHDQEEALAVSDRIIVMSNGKIAQIGTPRELYESPSSRFVADFIGDANLIEGQIENGAFRAPGLSLPLPATSRTGPAVISIRPERIVLKKSGSDGKVKSASYLGSRREYRVETAYGTLLVSAPISAPALEPGEEISVILSPGGYTLLSDA
ncbi:ABC transporter ATP-binding protein [Pelagibacterium limicola]|uniref:ABC transporter ATP-binding protein n=1 Tax=Pelagibacterium limicola TaxID=2791022 RepID=UPI0018AF8A4E|nr:ABC transporter ATP-binding protein [Pelagibacterium limicola]